MFLKPISLLKLSVVSFVSFLGVNLLIGDIDDIPGCAIRLLRTWSLFRLFTWPMRIAQFVYMFIWYLLSRLLL